MHHSFSRYGRRQPVTAERKAQLAAEREARKALTMTCQVCGRPILANTGVIAHHGYVRPGTGWQTASCGGARKLPFEITRADLGKEIENGHAYLADLGKAQKLVKEEKASVRYSFTIRIKSQHRFGTEEVTRWVSLTRDTYAAVLTENEEFAKHAAERDRQAYGDTPKMSFDKVLAEDLKARAGQIGRLKDYLAFQQKRFDGWRKTHIRQDDTWAQVYWVAK